MGFKLNDRVAFNAGGAKAGGTPVVGSILAHVPPGKLPAARHLYKGRGRSRLHPSYLVIDGNGHVYWPRVSTMRLYLE